MRLLQAAARDPLQYSRHGKISIIPFATALTPGSSRVSGVMDTSKRESVHLGSERNSRNLGSSEIFLRSLTMFVVLKWISSSCNLT